jgi:hypothetical protein
VESHTDSDWAERRMSYARQDAHKVLLASRNVQNSYFGADDMSDLESLFWKLFI